MRRSRITNSWGSSETYLQCEVFVIVWGIPADCLGQNRFKSHRQRSLLCARFVGSVPLAAVMPPCWPHARGASLERPHEDAENGIIRDAFGDLLGGQTCEWHPQRLQSASLSWQRNRQCFNALAPVPLDGDPVPPKAKRATSVPQLVSDLSVQARAVAVQS